MSDNKDVLQTVYRLLAADAAAVADAVLVEAAKLGDDEEARAAVAAVLKRGKPDGLHGLITEFSTLTAAAQLAVVAEADRFINAGTRVARGKDEAARLSAAAFAARCEGSAGVTVLASLLRCRDTTTAEAATAAVLSLANEQAADCETTRDALENAVADALDDPRSAVSGGRVAESNLADAAVQLIAAGAKRRPLIELLRRRGGMCAARLSSPRTAIEAAASLAAGVKAKQVLADALGGATGQGFVGFTEQAQQLTEPKFAAAVATLREGPWWSPQRLRDELSRHGFGRADAPAEAPFDLAKVGFWCAAGSVFDAELAELLTIVDDAASDDTTRLRTLRYAASATAARDAALPVSWLAKLAGASEQHLARSAAKRLNRQVERLEPGPHRQAAERALLAACAQSPAVRRTCGKTLTRCFTEVWHRAVSEKRREAPRAVLALLKLLPDPADAVERLALATPPAHRLATLQLAESAGLVASFAPLVMAACCDDDAKSRARGVTLLATVVRRATDSGPMRQLRVLLDDPDARVRANAVEALQAAGLPQESDDFRRLLQARERLGRNRERANAIVASDVLGVADANQPLFDMLRDQRADHRLSGVWAVGETRRWNLLDEVARIARSDSDAGVRRLAAGTVRRVADDMRKARSSAVAQGAAMVGVPMVATVDSDRLQALTSGFGGSKAESTADAGPVLAGLVLLVSGGLVFGLLGNKIRRRVGQFRVSHAGLDRRTCRAIGLPRDAARRLARQALRVGATSASTLLACPSLLRRLRESASGRDRLVIDLALMRLAY